jgi:hypothetical protein
MLDLANILFTVIYSITVPDNCESCPTYEELNLIYPDNTDPGVSGEIIDNVRTAPNMKKDWLWYEQQGYSYVIYYDPPFDVVNRSLHITIQPDLPAYKLNKGLSTTMANGTVQFGADRWVGNNCGESAISSKVWVPLLGDTMNYMNHQCDESQTIFNSNITYNYSDNSISVDPWNDWKISVQKLVEKWINEILYPYESDLSDKEWNEELEKIKN